MTCRSCLSLASSLHTAHMNYMQVKKMFLCPLLNLNTHRVFFHKDACDLPGAHLCYTTMVWSPDIGEGTRRLYIKTFPDVMQMFRWYWEWWWKTTLNHWPWSVYTWNVSPELDSAKHALRKLIKMHAILSRNTSIKHHESTLSTLDSFDEVFNMIYLFFVQPSPTDMYVM